MSRYRGNDETCEACGLKYRAFQTGLTYQGVHGLLKDYSDDPREWRYKRRGTVLGYWHALKKLFWERHREECRERHAHEDPQGDAYEDAHAWEALDVQLDGGHEIPF